jgi:hypothetical protein
VSMLWTFAQWSEASWIGAALRDSSWLFPFVEFFHLAGLAIIGGAVLVVDLRLLGLGLRKTPVAQLAGDAQPFLIGSLLVMIASGFALYASEATKAHASPAFWIKMISLGLVIAFTFTVRRRVTLAEESRVLPLASKGTALVSIALWSLVAWGGRWIGFGG